MSNQYLSFDVTKQSAPQQLIIGRQGDSQLKFVTMLFWDGDKNIPYNLVNKQVAFEALKPDDTHIVDYDGITILDAEAGLVRYSFNEQVFAVDGQIQQAFFKITHTDSDNNVIADSTLEVNITVLKNRVEFGINSKDYLSEYNKLVADVKKLFDDFSDTVKDSIEKAQALHDQIVEYTNLINANGVITKKEFGELSGIKQPVGATAVDKLNNEFSNRGLNVKWFGAKGDGANDDTQGIQAAIDTARENFCSIDQYQLSNLVVFPEGNYKISSKIILPPYVKIISQGFVKIIYSNDTGIGINIAYHSGDENEKNILSYNKQQYNKGSIINGDNGGFLIKYEGNNPRANNSNIGLQIGEDVDRGLSLTIGRYSIKGIAISGFYTGLQYSKYNVYMGSHYNLHIEENENAIVFGSEEDLASSNSSPINAGENMSYYGCVIAGGKNGVVHNISHIDCNFYGTSFDFLERVFIIRRGNGSINLFGGHIEQNNQLIQYDNQTDFDTYGHSFPAIRINDLLFYEQKSNNLKQFINTSKSDKQSIKIYLNNFRITATSRNDLLYLADDNVDIVVNNVEPRGLFLTPISKTGNPIRSSDFFDESQFTITHGGYDKGASFVTNDIPEKRYNKAIRLTGGTDINNWMQVVTNKSPLNGKQTLALKIPMYYQGEQSQFKDVGVVVNFFDKSGMPLDVPIDNNSMSYTNSGEWVFRYIYISNIPMYADSFSLQVTASRAQDGQYFWLGPFSTMLS